MSQKEWIEVGLRISALVLSWPVAFVLIVILFRAQLRQLLPDLARRVTKLPGGIELAAEKQLAALQDAARAVTEEIKDPAQVQKYLADLAKKVADSAILTGKPRAADTFAVLWVDDDPIGNQFESGLLRNLGAGITFVKSTSEALQKLKDTHFDVVISDVHRDEDGQSNPTAGYDLLDEIRRTGSTIPLIFYSTGIAREERMRSAFGFATTPSRLINLVQRVLGRKEVRVERPKRYDM